MKILPPLLILGLTSVALSAEEFTIQLLTAYQKTSMERVVEKAKNNGVLAEVFLGKNGRYILTYGTFKSRSEATKALFCAQKIMQDAFIRPVDSARVPYVCSSPAIANKRQDIQLPVSITPTVPTTATYMYDCSASKSGIVIPSDEQATNIIVQYNCK